MTRIDKLRAKLPADFGAALIENTYNRAYLTGFSSSAGALVVTRGRAVLIVDFRYIEAARAKTDSIEVALMTDTYKQVGDILDAVGVTALYIENQTTLKTCEKIKSQLGNKTVIGSAALSGAIRELRSVKEESEIGSIKSAQSITDAAFGYILGVIKPGVSERELAAELEYYMRKHGADAMAFPTICVAGKKSAMPHGETGDNTVNKGDFVTLDFGAQKDGYCSDMTRTIAVGQISGEHKRVYNTVLAAHLAAIDAARAGITGAELDSVARSIIDAGGFKGYFGHGLGHSLGLEVHEEPRASVNCDDVLESGTVMTIEPGIYLEKRFGVRIENMVVIRENGCENLTKSERELIVL